ncbi:MAG: hypothetical protein AAFQ27_00910 [Pseudomonadota bacterium]
MRYTLAMAASLALVACSDDAETTTADAPSNAAADASGPSDDTKDASGIPATTVALPMDLPLAPESYVSGDSINEYDFQGTPMAQFRLNSRNPSADVLSFYAAALEEADFEIASRNEDEGGGMLRATRADGSQVELHSINSGSSVAEGESGTTFTVTFGSESQ